MGRNEVKVKSKVRGGQRQEEKETEDGCVERTPAGTGTRQDKAILGREKKAMRRGLARATPGNWMKREWRHRTLDTDRVGGKQRLEKGWKDGTRYGRTKTRRQGWTDEEQ